MSEATERDQWIALRDEPRLDMLPQEVLAGSIRHLARRLLELTDQPTGQGDS